MLTKLKNLLFPPSLKGTHDNRAFILNAILVSAITGLSIFLFISHVADLFLVPTSDILMLVLITLMSGLLVLVRHGKVKEAAAALMVFGWFAVSYQAWITGGIRGSAFFANVLIILAASLLVGPKAATFFAFLGIASAWVFAFAEGLGFLNTYFTPPFMAAFEMTLMLVLATVLAYLLIRNIAKALEDARESNRRLQSFSQDLENKVVERTQSAESARAEAEAARLAMESRVWLTTSVAQLANCMRGEQSVPTLATNVIRQLCLHLEAQLGTLYLLEEGMLVLQGSYAFTPPNQDVYTFRLGEGLIGQAFQEEQPILLTEIPPNYLAIKSTLGQIFPKTILAQPFIFEEQVIGVFEIASLSDFSSSQLEYLEVASESIAIAFNTAIARARINELLLETQAQATALRVQEEKLRSTNAELERTASVLKDQQNILDTQNRALENTRVELEKRAEELERASRYKSEFLANMSHELRTPLNSLLLLARMLAENSQNNLTDDQIQSAEIIHSSGQDLLNLINEILDLSKIEAGKMVFDLAPMSLSEMTRSMELQFGHLAKDKGLKFETEIDPAAPTHIQTDQQRMEQVVRNLLSNAFKFTEEGFVRLVVEQIAHDPESESDLISEEKFIAIRVMDTGIGMTPEQQKIVFEGFQQADGSTSRKYGGTGLGLTISRQIVQNLGGKITVRSAIGSGSIFSILLPIRDVPLKREGQNGQVGEQNHKGENTHHEPQSPQKIRKIPLTLSNTRPLTDDRQYFDPHKPSLLIIEDDVNFSRIIAEEAQKKGYQFLAASTGETGLELAAKYKPHAIILDLRLPDISGWDVLGKIRSNSTLRKVPIQILSVEDEHVNAQQQDVIGFFTKPVTREELNLVFDKFEKAIDFFKTVSSSIQTMDSASSATLLDDQGTQNLNQTFSNPSAAINPAIQFSGDTHILTVDDDVRNAFALSKLLRERGLRVTLVQSGSKALEILESDVDISLVLMDIMMPVMDGFETIKRIRTQPRFAKLPIIALTAKAMKGDLEKCLEAGADDYLSKPIEIDQLVDKLHRLLSTNGKMNANHELDGANYEPA